jgi:HK97 family phage major capsid protein
MTEKEIRARRAEATRERERLLTELANLQARAEHEGETDGLTERAGNLNRGIEKLDDEIRNLERQLLVVLDRRTDRVEETTPPATTKRRADRGPGSEAREAAYRVIEERSADLSPAAGDRLVDLVRRDRMGADARYIAAVASPDYESAFATMLAYPSDAHLRFSGDEVKAVRHVHEATIARDMLVGVGGQGGFAVPFALDPSIILASDGALNPIRGLATVSTIATSEWRGVSSTGVTAAFAAEAAEASDNAPALLQPTIKPERAQMWVPFSIELGMDWPGLAAELGGLFADARDVLEASKFLTGDGSDEPEGLLVGATTTVETAGSGALAAGDVYSLQEALPARFQPRASFLSSLAIANDLYRAWNPTGEEPPLFNEARDRLLGKPWYEVSGMDVSPSAGDLVLVYGDLRAGYRIVDRIGLTVELVPHLMGANRMPTGQRGLYAYFRVGAGVVAPNAIRVLEVKS